MGKLFGLLLLVSTFSTNCFAQKITLKVTMENKVATAANDTIYYSSERPLTWNDFQGVPDRSGPAGAVTSSGFAFNANMNMIGSNVTLTVNVFTFFSKRNSWKRFNINSDYHLLHEQHHFDLTRIGAQKFYEDLQKANFTLDNYNKLLTSIFNRDFDESTARQQQYDRETHNSIDTAAQTMWNDKIASEIKMIL